MPDMLKLKSEEIKEMVANLLENAPTSEEEMVAFVSKLAWDYLKKQWMAVLIAGALTGIGHEIGRQTIAALLKMVAEHRAQPGRKITTVAFGGPWG